MQQIIAYFNACFQADNREHSLWDLFSNKNEFLHVVNETQIQDLASDNSCRLNWKYGLKLEKNVAIYRREKMLLFGHYFIFGMLPIGGGLSKRLTRICAPLLITELTISEGNNEYIGRIDQSMYRWNTPLLSLITEDSEIESKLQTAINKQGLINSPQLVALLEASILPSYKIELFNEIQDLEQLKVAKSLSSKNMLSLAPGSCFVFTKRSTASRGVIDELNTMSQLKEQSNAVAQLLYQSGQKKWISSDFTPSHIPGLLSHAQQNALKNAAQKDLSVLIGPPGTGKSYTIACIILERFMHGESVLLVTQNESAVDVVQQKLTEYLGICANSIIRAGSKHYHQDLKRKLADILGGVNLQPEQRQQQSHLKRILKVIKKAERRFVQDAKSAVKDGLFLDDFIQGNITNHWFNRIKKWLIDIRTKKQTPLHKQLSFIHSQHKTRESVLADVINTQYLDSLHNLLDSNRQYLVKFDSALRARTSLGQESRFLNIDYDVLLKALPIWLSSLSGLHRSLPMKTDLFDLVIIDEATQCNIASCLPALHRAKRALVVGDPKQLRHISFLSAKKQQRLLQKFQLHDLPVELNYRDHSMIDFALAQVPSQEAIVMLDEHYRSMPEIIQFSNARFYSNNLKIMTAKPTTTKKAAIRVVYVDNAVRNKGVNAKEIEVLIDTLNEILAFQKQLPQQHQQSIGILSFFSDQAEALQKILIQQFDIRTLMQHNIRSATPYGFQGEERDIMLISCGVDSKSSSGVYHYLNRSDVFNVAVTRARDLQYLFVSAQVEHMPKHNLLADYLNYTDTYVAEKNQHRPRLDVHLKILCDQLHQLGLQTVHQYIVAGIPMDLLVIYKDQVLALDLIGFPGEYQDVLHIERYHIFSRAQLPIFPLSFSAWQMDQTQVLSTIEEMLKDMHQQSIHNISVAHRTKEWRKINPIDASLATKVRKTEHRLIAGNHNPAIEQLYALIELYCQLKFSLSEKLNPGELTWLRYRQSITRIVETCLQRFDQLVIPFDKKTDKTSSQILAENQSAIEKLQHTEAHLKSLILEEQQEEVTVLDDFEVLDHLNRKMSQFGDMDDF